MVREPQPRPSPFRGPRPFQAGETLYGRDYEARALFSTLVAERIVLLHSPSGAGKTSLIQAALMPMLEEREFAVLPTVRVGQEPPPGWAGNRYLRATLLSLEEGRPPEQARSLAELESLSLAAYLAQRLPAAVDQDTVLVVDQFEEVLTHDPTDPAAKQAFFRDLGDALRMPRLWALFVIREEYVAALEPYTRLLPTRLATHFRLDLLGVEGALAALREPPRQLGVDFPEALAARLVDDLRRVNVQQADGTIAQQLGPSVEPVQLQVVGLRLWEGLPPEATAISEAELAAVGDVGSALGDYYAGQLVAVAVATGVSERALRTWFDRELITPQEVRGQVLQGQDASAGLANSAIRRLVDAYLVRAEPRRGATWFELAHDRLIRPVRAGNAAWFAANLSTLQRQAELWAQQDRPAGLLLSGATLREAEQWAAANSEALTEAERDLLQRSREAARLSRRVRGLAIGATLLAVCATLAFVTALWFFNRAEEQRRAAERQAQISRARELAAAAVSSLPLDGERSLMLASAAVATTAPNEPPLPEAVDALQQAAQAPRPERTLVGHSAGITSAAYSPDGATVATAGNDGTVRIWPVAGGAPTTWEVDVDLLAVVYAPDGSIAAADLDSVVYLWAPDGAERWSVTLDTPAARLRFSPAGDRLAAATDGGELLLLDAADGTERARLAPPARENGAALPLLYSLAFSPDGRAVIAGDADGGVTLWELGGAAAPAGTVLASPHTDSVEGAAWSPDGASFATADAAGLLTLWDATAQQPARSLRSYSSGFYDVAYSPDGLMLATASPDGTARLWELSGDTPLLTLPGHTNYVTAVAFSPDGQRLVTASLDRTARIWSLALLPPDGAASLAFSPDGATLATGGSGRVRLWDEATGVAGLVLPVSDAGELVTAIAFSPDGGRVAAAAGSAATVWDSATGEELASFAGHSDFVGRLAWSPGGDLIATAGDDLTLRVWDAATGEQRYVADDHSDWVRGLAWSTDGATLATCDSSSGVVVRDAATGTARLSFSLPDVAGCNALALSPNGARLATAEPNGQLILWDAATGAELLRLYHLPEAADVVFSPDGASLYSAGRDRRVRRWDTVTGAPLGVISMPAEPQELRLSPDGRRLAVAGADNIPRVYPLVYEDLLALARARPTRPPSAAECAAYGPLPGCVESP